MRNMPKTESEICISNLTPLYVGQCSTAAFPSDVIFHLSNGHNGTGGAPHNDVGVCEVNVFFKINGQLNVRIHSSHCSDIFISLKRNEIVVLGSGCTYTNFEDLMRMVAHLQSSIKDHLKCPTTGCCWRVRQVSNIPILHRVK